MVIQVALRTVRGDLPISYLLGWLGWTDWSLIDRGRKTGALRDRRRGLPGPGGGQRPAADDRSVGRAVPADPGRPAADGVAAVPGPDRARLRRGRAGHGRAAGRQGGRPGRWGARGAGHGRTARHRGPGAGRRAAAGGAGPRPAGDPGGRDGVRRAARGRPGRGGRVAGPQAGWAGRPARPGHAAGGPLPGPDRHRVAAAGDRHRDHPGRPGRGPCRRPQAATDPGAGLQHLLRPEPGRGHPGRRRAGRGRAAGSPGRQPGAADAGPADVPLGRDPGQAGRDLRGRVQVRRDPGPSPPHRRRRP